MTANTFSRTVVAGLRTSFSGFRTELAIQMNMA